MPRPVAEVSARGRSRERARRSRAVRRHRVGALGGLADPQREVVGRRGAGVAVVGLAVGVAAGGRLEVDAADRAPADGERDLLRQRAAPVAQRLGDDPADHDREHRRQRHGLGGGRGVRRRGQLVGRVVVGVADDEPGRGEHQHGDVPAHLVGSNVVSWCTRNDSTVSPATAASTASATSSG